MRLRVEGADGDRDVRLPFAQPVDDILGLSQAIRVLMGCPFVNGLRARRSDARRARLPWRGDRARADVRAGCPATRAGLEIVVVLAVTFGLSAVTAMLQLADAVLRDLAPSGSRSTRADPTSTSSTSASTWRASRN